MESLGVGPTRMTSAAVPPPISLFAKAALSAARLWRQTGGLARRVGVGKGLDADDPPIVDGQERGSGLIDFGLVRQATMCMTTAT